MRGHLTQNPLYSVVLKNQSITKKFQTAVSHQGKQQGKCHI